MRRVIRFCGTLTAVWATVGFAASAHAAVTVFKPTINIFENLVAANCNFTINKDRP